MYIKKRLKKNVCSDSIIFRIYVLEGADHMNENRKYSCIDLKSFYAFVECRERGLDPMKVKLVVADPERTDKTICLAVSPAMKALGVPGRCRVFEIPDGIEYIMAPPRMQLYIDYEGDHSLWF